MTFFIGVMEVVIGVIIAELLMEHIVQPLLASKPKRPDIYCDGCNQVRYLTQTPDKNLWLCDEFIAAYMLEYEKELIEEAPCHTSQN